MALAIHLGDRADRRRVGHVTQGRPLEDRELSTLAFFPEVPVPALLSGGL